MLIVGSISKDEVNDIEFIAKVFVVSNRARYLGGMVKS